MRCEICADVLPPYATSVGKQTVAEAASSRGASLDAYLDPASEDDDMHAAQHRDDDMEAMEAHEQLVFVVDSVGSFTLSDRATPPWSHQRTAPSGATRDWSETPSSALTAASARNMSTR